MRSKRFPWKGLFYVFIIALIVVLGLYLLLPGFIRFQQLQYEKAQLEDDLNKKENTHSDLERFLHSLQHNPSAAEKVARDEMGMSKDNEIIYKFDR